MQLGSYEIPEVRLVPDVIELMRKVKPHLTDGAIQSKDLALLLGYKYGTETQFYRQLRAMVWYGLLEGKGVFRITELGRVILDPINEEEEKIAKMKAVLNVPLWRELYKKWKRNVDGENFWVQIMNVTGVERDIARDSSNKLLRWYLADTGLIDDNLMNKTSSPTETLRSSNSNDKQLSQTLQQPRETIQQNKPEEDVIKYELRKSTIYLPKVNPKKEWEKIKKMIDIDLEDYEEPTKSEESSNG